MVLKKGTLNPAYEGMSNEEVLAIRPVTDAAANEVVLRNIGFVKMSVNRFLRYRQEIIDDLYQEAVLGLMEAARRFDPSREIKFLTYAAWFVRKNLIGYTFCDRSGIRIPTSINALRESYRDSPILKSTRRLYFKSDDGDQPRSIPSRDPIPGHEEESHEAGVMRDFDGVIDDLLAAVASLRPKLRFAIEQKIGLNAEGKVRTNCQLGKLLRVNRMDAERTVQSAWNEVDRKLGTVCIKNQLRAYRADRNERYGENSNLLVRDIDRIRYLRDYQPRPRPVDTTLTIDGDYATRIGQLRQHFQWSQRELGRRVGLSGWTIRDIENGKRRGLTLRYLDAISRAFADEAAQCSVKSNHDAGTSRDDRAAS